MKLTYKDSGVDVKKGYEEVQLIKGMVESTHNKQVLTGLGGFAGLFALNKDEYKEPVLVSGTDGVGTKLMIAQALDKHDTIGVDLVAMCVNDILCQGAKPLFFLDYIATGELDPEKMQAIIQGVVDGCKQSDSALIGGETAEMPDLYDPESYDLAGFSVGVVDKEKIITREAIKPGDVAIALKSSGIHSNGLSLARKALEVNDIDFKDTLEGYDKSIGEVLLTPTKIYAKEINGLLEKVSLHGIAHITGGGLDENLTRVLPKETGLKIHWPQENVPQVFQTIQQLGNVETQEMFNTFNMGIGMVVFVPEDSLEEAQNILNDLGSEFEVLGAVDNQTEGIEVTW
ncbi:phosphoribosylformylglycinamidine cyclo-ligase [Dolosicoccus paucivorans]|uniref:Phosphoribosylformylglycinamidine cyclo-ligase n=1 Tax=Dolosicoccus paucivorans TaxID=84521 RepID=A0A2N6SNP1_9LACT|nr:phosphoribosylformylglycinamidine cyclo-ligase [Dolosicoccus paucivorans]PMB84222.1 phosphoribosylformylglycinamidine cyclo-ligase [Dolosicoccus paucivorans]PMC58685.1 phosphoribosylformylglycinamidine cyclo-ligase [Dolosicoccus paucivorans]